VLAKEKRDLFRRIPAVDRLLKSPGFVEVLAAYPRSLVLRAIHQVLDEIRRQILSGEGFDDPAMLDVESISHHVRVRLEVLSRPSLRPVVNATGIVVHTNLGRSILAEKALRRFRPIAGGYSNLEYDLAQGKRGSRYTHVEGILKEITGAEAAMVVNNNAAAVLLSLDTLAKGREVVVSRGQLV
jgi:L-seryl-tRNA(Ser) seleniumtransferase